MLLPVHFTIAGQFNFDNSSIYEMQAGRLVTLTEVNNEAFVAPCDAADQCIGVAGDSYKSDSTPSATGYAADITINPSGDTVRSQNRISDVYKETLASGAMTVYSGSGTFFTDQYDTSVVAWTLGQALYSNAGGKITNVDGGGNVIGHLVGKPTAYPSGVPGTDVLGSISLGTLIKFTLNV